MMSSYAPKKGYQPSQQQQQPFSPMPLQPSPLMPRSYEVANGPIPSSPPGLMNNNASPTPDSAEQVIGNRVFVGSLQAEVNEEIIRTVFEKVEPTFKISEVKVVREPNGESSKGFGFVTYDSEHEAQAIMNKPPGTFTYKSRSWNISKAVRRYSRHSPSPSYVYCQYSPSLIHHPNGMVYPSYMPQVYSPSPYVNSPMMQQGHFVFPVPHQGPAGDARVHHLDESEYPPLVAPVADTMVASPH